MMNFSSNSESQSYLPQPALARIANRSIFDTQCEGHQILDKIANKWTILIIYALTQGKKRYSDLKQQIQGISPKMLVQNLRNLERNGLVNREVYPTIPPRVDYSLTPLGEWAYQHISDVNAAIEQYDRRPKSKDFWQPK